MRNRPLLARRFLRLLDVLSSCCSLFLGGHVDLLSWSSAQDSTAGSCSELDNETPGFQRRHSAPHPGKGTGRIRPVPLGRGAGVTAVARRIASGATAADTASAAGTRDSPE